MTLAANMTSEDWHVMMKPSTVCILPIGSVEQHGPHLPLGTDARLVEAIAHALDAELGDAVVTLPTIPYGSAANHAAFPGTIDLGGDLVVELLTRVGVSVVNAGARRVLVLNGHGGNAAATVLAIRQIKTRTGDARPLVAATSYWSPIRDSIHDMTGVDPMRMAHACQLETSLALHYGWDVRLDRAVNDGLQPAPRYAHIGMFSSGPVSLAMDHDELTETGVFGDPRSATPELGARLHDLIVQTMADVVHELGSAELPRQRVRSTLVGDP